MARFHTPQYDERNGTYFVWVCRNGVKKYYNFGTNKKIALQKLRQLEQDLDTGKVTQTFIDSTATTTPAGGKDMRIEELIHRHLQWVEANRSPGTLRNRIGFLNQFKEFVGECMVSSITRMKLEEFYQWAKVNKSRSENGGNEHLANVKAMLRWGEEMEIVDLSFKRFPKIVYTPPEVTIVDPKTLKLILENAPPDFRDMIMFGLLTGLRPFELLPLKQSQITYAADRPYIVIQKHKTSRSSSTPKPRSVLLCHEAEAIFLRHVELHPSSEYVFLNEDGEPFSSKAFNDRFERICQRLEIPKIKPYDLRHTFASLQSDDGTETTALAQLMGHSSTRTLMRYVKNSHEHHKKAMEGLEKRLMPLLSVKYGDAPPGERSNANRKFRKPWMEKDKNESE